MRSHVHNPKDFWSGLIFLTVGAAAFWLASDHDRGSAGSMGPGYFPTVLSALLVAIGGACLLRSMLGRREPVGRWALRRAALVLLAVVSFGWLVRGTGLAPAVAIMVILAGLAHPRFRWASYSLLALTLAGLCVLLFVWGLGLPVPALGDWLTGWLGH